VTGDYLWDRSGLPDPDVVRLERLLGTLRGADQLARPLVFPIAVPARRPAMASIMMVTALAATVIGLIAVSWRGASAPLPGLEVTRLDGTPTIESHPITDRLELRAGGWLETDGQARASIDIASIGRVEVEPGTRLGLVSTRPGQHRLQLTRGTMHALIWAPPGQFAVETPSSVAVDLGCAYTLKVDDDGVGHIRVTTGWVGFEWRGRESFIPAGAVCLTRPALGPGTPYFEDTSAPFRAALRGVGSSGGHFRGEKCRAGSHPDRGAREGCGHPLASALASRSAERGRVFDRLAQFGTAAGGVTPRRCAGRPETNARRLVGHAWARRGQLVARLEAAVAREVTLEVPRNGDNQGFGGTYAQGSAQKCGHDDGGARDAHRDRPVGAGAVANRPHVLRRQSEGARVS
jgi:hypothetical protein